MEVLEKNPSFSDTLSLGERRAFTLLEDIGRKVLSFLEDSLLQRGKGSPPKKDLKDQRGSPQKEADF